MCIGQTDHPTRRISCQKLFHLTIKWTIADFGKEKWIAARSLWATSARSRLRQKRIVLRVERRVREVEMDFSLNPSAKLPHCGCFGLLSLRMGAAFRYCGKHSCRARRWSFGCSRAISNACATVSFGQRTLASHRGLVASIAGDHRHTLAICLPSLRQFPRCGFPVGVA